ncbi:Uncharacterised protein [Dermatophilus congolensis]|uniref:Bacteriocin biosynthesis cyclodehydratase domain n=1 Tax=Dermatophilus congolensis TaxID=1863 RepID=A0AA46BNI4_9MICO|nr:hypothetical protein [Dermatophilus congolensis]STD10173.1 Uncharacterised protein [Dermatophilus congolensis]
MNHPRLAPTVRVLDRGPGCLHIGHSPSHGIVIDGLDPTEIHYLRALETDSNTTLTQRDIPTRAPQLNQLLTDANLTHSTNTTPLNICVTGHNDLATGLRTTLHNNGHHLISEPHPERPHPHIDLAILTDIGGVPYIDAHHWNKANIPHLPVTLDGCTITIGPWITPEGPCLHCIDLTRSDEDPAWPHLLAQTSGRHTWDTTDHCGNQTARTALAIWLTTTAIQRLATDPTTLTRENHTSLTWNLLDASASHTTWNIHPHCPTHTP